MGDYVKDGPGFNLVSFTPEQEAKIRAEFEKTSQDIIIEETPKLTVTLEPEVMELLRSIAADLDYLAMRRDLG